MVTGVQGRVLEGSISGVKVLEVKFRVVGE